MIEKKKKQKLTIVVQVLIGVKKIGNLVFDDHKYLIFYLVPNLGIFHKR